LEQLRIFTLREQQDDLLSALVHRPDRQLRVTNRRAETFTRFSKGSFLMAADGFLTGLGRVRVERTSGDFDVLYRVEDIQTFSQPIRWDALVHSMPPGKQPNLDRAFGMSGAIAPQAQQQLIDLIRQVVPDIDAMVARTLAIADPHTLPENIRDTVREQRDAVALGLELSGIDSRMVLDHQSIVEREEPFLTTAKRTYPSEAAFIRHDSTRFPGWLTLGGTDFDSCAFSDPEDPHRRVTIFYADKEPLEKLTGTDLLYYEHQSRSFVLVQYKRLKPGDGKLSSYRPDPQLAIEIARMKALGLIPSPREVARGFPALTRAVLHQAHRAGCRTPRGPTTDHGSLSSPRGIRASARRADVDRPPGRGSNRPRQH
jgi:hypothetical protein